MVVVERCGKRAPRVTWVSRASAGQKLQADVKLTQLKLGERDGSLVERSAVEKFLFERARFERDQWVGWVSRAAPAIAAEIQCDPTAVFALVDRLVRKQLSELAQPTNSIFANSDH